MTQVMCKCVPCGNSFKFGNGAYHGKHMPGYEMMVCSSCYDANWDGWAPALEPRILQHLATTGIEKPRRNAEGFLPRDWPRSDERAKS